MRSHNGMINFCSLALSARPPASTTEDIIFMLRDVLVRDDFFVGTTVTISSAIRETISHSRKLSLIIHR